MPDLEEAGLEVAFLPFEVPVKGGAGLVAPADLDGDGKVDILVGDPGGREDVAVHRACPP